jgi:hypothetical protein
MEMANGLELETPPTVSTELLDCHVQGRTHAILMETEDQMDNE